MTLPVLPRSIALLPPSLSGLALTSPGGTEAFFVDGARVRVGSFDRGARTHVSIDGTPVLSSLDSGLGSTVNTVTFPGAARREFAGPGGSCLEAIVAAPTLPFAVVQWSGVPSACPREISFEMPGIHAAAVGIEGDIVVCTFPDGRIAAAGMPGGSPYLAGVDAEGVRVRFTDLEQSHVAPAVAHVTLVVAHGSAAEVRSAFAASEHVLGHARRAAAHPVVDGITLSTGVAEIDDGVAWAVARVRGELNRSLETQPGDPGRRLILGLAAIASGDREVSARIVSGAEEGPDAVHALLAARAALTWGDSAWAARIGRAWTEDAHHAVDDPLGVVGLARGLLADGLRHAAPEAVIAGLRLSSPTVQVVRPPSNGPRRLPVVGGATDQDSGRWAAWLQGLLAGDPSGPAPRSPLQKIEEVRRACHDFRTAPEAAWTAWRSVLASGITGGRMAWWGPSLPAAGLSHDPDDTPAELILCLVHGLLGYAPDAPAGRLRLAPRFPAHLTGFTVRGLALGDAKFTMAYQRSDSTHRYTVEPTLAAVPPLMVFEPAIPGTVSEVRVDGVRAELDVKRLGDRTITPLQIAIDSARSIEIDTE